MKRFVLHSSSPLRRFPDNSGKENFIHLARILQCNAVHDANKVDCLREKSVESLLQASEAIQATSPVFVPSFGTHLLPSTELLSLPSRISGKQFLLVNVRDEGSYFLQLLVQRLRHGNYVNTEAVHRYILQLLAILGIGDHAQSIRAMYANVTSDSELGVWCSILGDVLFVCPMQYLAKYLVAAGNSVKVMVFGQRPSWKDTTTSGYGDDLSFLFGIPLLPSGSGTSDEREFSVTVIKYWSTFVKTGTLPKLINGEQWPDLRSTSPLATVELKMDGARLLEPPFRTKQCDALQHILLQPRG
ncbi:acetylcholinesterase-1-like isoform X2 [Ornithodoros turicata]